MNFHKASIFNILLLGLISITFLHCLQTQYVNKGFKTPEPVWSDEFSVDGYPDNSKWSYDLGDGCPNVCGWGNNELEFYTNSLKNARVENGLLIIEAHKEPTGTKEYSSARLVSKGKGDWLYGRIEVRAKLPNGRGVWPAIWMLSTDWNYGGWPESGEIDIMENVGYLPDSLFATVHTKNYNHVDQTQKSGELHSKTLSSEFHVYGLDWEKDKMTFSIDNQSFFIFENDQRGFKSWPFDQKFHLLLNLAVGGNWGGKMGVDGAIWPRRMEVDYVRVYQ